MSDKLSTVRKLLSKAERAGTTEEAEAFTAKATELMLRYSIDEAMLGARHESADELTSKRFVVTGGYSKPKSILLNQVVEAFGAKAIRVMHGRETVVMVYGFTSDLETIEVLFASLLVQADREGKREFARLRHTVHGKTFTTSFLIGFATTVHTRLLALRKKTVTEAEASTPGTEVALYDRERAAARALAKDHPRVRSTGGSAVSSRAGYYSGQEAGKRADLGQGGLGGSRVALGR